MSGTELYIAASTGLEKRGGIENMEPLVPLHFSTDLSVYRLSSSDSLKMLNFPLPRPHPKDT